MVTKTMLSAAELTRILDVVVDPDIPVMTIAEIGILRDVSVTENGAVTVGITPTYSGCPALAVMEEDIVAALAGAGVEDVTVEVRHTPVWTTEWLTDEAKRKLVGFGIAPPDSVLAVVPEVLCPQCSSSGTAKISEFGSTACKSLWVCTTCLEPFDYFKAI
ncbi:MAG: phenylacetate-CoA oxygenase subunit PaaJ [Actinomycetota bacterium]|nr:phenylacetate-CoA oxygenase subunit PaaJ [Actinomycetota bacterium]